MTTRREYYGYQAFLALTSASHALRADGFHAHAAEVDAMALRLREILYAAKEAEEQGGIVRRVEG